MHFFCRKAFCYLAIQQFNLEFKGETEVPLSVHQGAAQRQTSVSAERKRLENSSMSSPPLP